MPSHAVGAVCKWMKSLKNPFDCVLSSSCSMQPHTPGNRVILVCAKFYYLIMNGMFLIWGSCIPFVEFEWVTECSTTAAVFSGGCWIGDLCVRLFPVIPQSQGRMRSVCSSERGGRWARFWGTCVALICFGQCAVQGWARCSCWEVDLVWLRSVKPQLRVDFAPFLSWHGYFCVCHLCL